MNEVFAIADEVSVFRDGRHVATDLASNLDRDRVITLMVGRELTQMYPESAGASGATWCSRCVTWRLSRSVRATSASTCAAARSSGLAGPGRLRPHQRRRDVVRRDPGDLGQHHPVRPAETRVALAESGDAVTAWRC